MSLAAEGFNLKQIGEGTGSHPENVRRYMQHGRISARFLGSFCLAFEVDPRWLLFGRGPMKLRNGQPPKVRGRR